MEITEVTIGVSKFLMVVVLGLEKNIIVIKMLEVENEWKYGVLYREIYRPGGWIRPSVIIPWP